jgi:hypothetical protein
MKLAVKASCDERSDILRAMARSWTTLANQMDRLESNRILQKYRQAESKFSNVTKASPLKR